MAICVSNKGTQDLLVVAYAFNPNSMVFSHQYTIICELSQKFRHVYVIANEVDELATRPANLTTVDLKWSASSSISNLLKLYKAFFQVYAKSKSVVVFSFMTETQSMVLGPLTKLLRIHHILWYAHTSSPLRLRIASKFVNRILTSTSQSVPPAISASSKRFLAIGQMVDNKRFNSNQKRNFTSRNRWIHVGRIDPSKELDVLTYHFKNHLKHSPGSTFIIVGQSTPGNESYESLMKDRCKNEIESGKIIFRGKQTQEQIRELLEESDLFVHAFQGSLDKALIEATMAGVTVITSNKAYLEQFGYMRRQLNLDEDAGTLLEKDIEYWRTMTDEELELLSNKRQQIAIDSHSLEQWLVRLLVELEGNK